MSVEKGALEDGADELKRIMLLTVVWTGIVVIAGVLLVLFNESFAGLFF